MTEENKKEPLKAEKETKVWTPKLTLTPRYDKRGIRVRSGSNYVDRRMPDGTIGQRVETNSLVLSIEGIRNFPATHARKYGLWHMFKVSESDKTRLLSMTIAEVSMKERTGDWS